MERKFSERRDPDKLNLFDNNLPKPDNTIDDVDTATNPNHIFNNAFKADAEFKEPDETATDNILQDKSQDIVDKPDDPAIRYTLESNFKEIDQFISGLSIEDKDDGLEKEKDQEEKNVVPAYVDKFLNLVQDKIAKCDVNNGKGKPWYEDYEDDTTFFDSINRVSKLTTRLDNHGYRSNQNYITLFNRVRGIQQLAMSCLEEEFRMLLEKTKIEPEAHCNSGDSEPTNEKENNRNGNSGDLGYSQDVLTSMNRIARAMIEGGFESECCQCYMIGRRQIFDRCQKKNDFHCLCIDDIQKMQWEELEREIPSWTKKFKDCATIYFSREHSLAETVFVDYPSISSSLFSNLTRGIVIQLLNFAEGVATTERSAEKLFKFLDMYEALRDSISTMDGLFPEECENEVKNEMFSVRSRIGEAAICIFRDLENKIKSDNARTMVPGGAVHPSTRYTMNYLKLACDYRSTLEQVFRKHSKIEPADSDTRLHFDGSKAQNTSNNNDVQEKKLSPFANQLTRLMDVLDSNLQDKSKLYRDVALSCIFMMNNGRYMLQKVKGSAEIYEAMGDTWCRKMSSELRNYHKSYQRETWNKVLGCLAHEGLQVNGKVQKTVLKERFKSFNTMFDEIHKTQSTWIVSDEQLQSELRVSLTAIMIPAYRSFLGRFAQHLDHGRQSEKYIKYQPEDIENMIDELFDGNATGMARRRQ